MNQSKITLKCRRHHRSALLWLQCRSALEQPLLLLIPGSLLLLFGLRVPRLFAEVSRSGSDPGQASVWSLVLVDDLQSVGYQAGQLVQVLRRQGVHVHVLPADVLQDFLDEPLWRRSESTESDGESRHQNTEILTMTYDNLKS